MAIALGRSFVARVKLSVVSRAASSGYYSNVWIAIRMLWVILDFILSRNTSGRHSLRRSAPTGGAKLSG
jgi:hypothetical protein